MIRSMILSSNINPELLNAIVLLITAIIAVTAPAAIIIYARINKKIISKKMELSYLMPILASMITFWVFNTNITTDIPQGEIDRLVSSGVVEKEALIKVYDENMKDGTPGVDVQKIYNARQRLLREGKLEQEKKLRGEIN